MEKLHNKSNDPALESKLQDLLLQAQNLYHTEIELSLERVETLLAKLDNPHFKCPPVVHIAGTNGKGSTLAILRSLLEHSGKSVHVMTSPHLVHPTERIRLAGELITTQGLIDVLERTLSVNEGAAITYFEALVIASFVAMSRVDADFTLLETGMGGRFDVTNVVPNPVCTIITNISKDHQEFLGNDLKQIAFEKAGIMKAGVPCIIGVQSDEAIKGGVLDSFHQQSTTLSPGAPVLQCGSDWVVEPMQDKMKFTWQGESIVCPIPSLIGSHQIDNAGAAMAAYSVIMNGDSGSNILSTYDDQTPLVDALSSVHWPGRLQRVGSGALLNALKSNQELWIDGGHNESAGKVLVEQAKQWRDHDNKPLHLIVAMVDRKDPTAFLSGLVLYADSITVVNMQDEPTAYKAEALYKKIELLGFKTLNTEDNGLNALQNNQFDENARILMTGSLYFLGEMLAY